MAEYTEEEKKLITDVVNNMIPTPNGQFDRTQKVHFPTEAEKENAMIDKVAEEAVKNIF